MNWELGSKNNLDRTHVFSCVNATQRDVNATVTASQVITGSYALLFYLVLLALSILGVCFGTFVQVLSSRATSFLFLIGTLLVGVNIFSNSANLEVRVYFRLPTAFLVGIVFVLAGAVCFFSKPEEVANQSTLARQQPSMGLVVGAITIPLIIAEIFLLASAGASKNEETVETLEKNSWPFVFADKTTFLAQKVIQAIVYIAILRYKTICPRYKESAKFYLKTLAFFNFIEWLDSQVNEDIDIKLSHANIFYSAWFEVFAVFYKALIIDYRLLCSLLFLEHSLEDEMADNEDVHHPANGNMTLLKKQYRTLGYIMGLLSLSAPICTTLYFVSKLGMPAWVHVFAIIVNLAIVGYGAFFLRSNDLEPVQERLSGSRGVQIMACSVCCLGAVGFTCWMVKAAMSGYWAASTNDAMDDDYHLYFAWTSAKFYARAISAVFLMGLFLKVDVRSLPQKNPDVIRNHFLVPAVMLAIFGAFAESLIDQYVGPVDKRLSCEINDTSLDILFTAGPPMYLGFLIHMVLHFVIIEAEIVKHS